MKKGKFIVIDGTDGSGKNTQTDLLVKTLKKQACNVKTIDFPQYEKNFFGKMVGRYLSGEFGGASEVSPYLASILYAGDRFETKEKIEKWLKDGNIVIADRYVSSNQIHQGGKIKDSKKRKEFLKWLNELEYGVFNLPKPDTIIYLDMPLDVSLRLLGNKSAQDRKKYLDGKKDIHESDSRHLEDAKKNAIEIVKKSNNWIKINCAKGGAPLKPEEISKIILEKLKLA
ncbi:MAG: dTMP kinase [Candidatus Terrybacteria bacterium CG10_big_fil_rev_8_21_14_0_10_41_10]|uniref:Thymidylate kinase n=1 Tax=Candidatus Terrybacteria bacterium CG10_big_fil_rev_8_21_14_0_10_41_10 TaxID=1975026 RepID=A0A2M8LAH3_9BACT|nr:MAG: dTMP kinase [Candidatus Terrybacteria bacterium CG10_big_fil_rev_8_21_14_0_10_41_10]